MPVDVKLMEIRSRVPENHDPSSNACSFGTEESDGIGTVHGNPFLPTWCCEFPCVCHYGNARVIHDVA